MTAAPALILGYHRIADGPDPLLQCVAPERFAEQVHRLRQIAEVVPLRSLDSTSPQRRIAITFDDGYADNADVAAPVLREADLPATYFVPSRILDDGREHWWDRLEHIVLSEYDHATHEFVELDLAGRRLRIDVRTPEGRARALKAVNHRMRSRSLAEIDAVLDDLRSQLGVAEPAPCDRHRLMTATSIATLAAHDAFEIGSHAATHTMLSALRERALSDEVTGSRARIGNCTGRAVTSLAYPYGTPDSFGRDAVELARRSGYARACANTAGSVRRRTDRMSLPRCMVYDWDGDEFDARVNAWFEQF